MRHALAFVCLLLSGAAGLICEVCWIRQSALIFGCTTYALSTTLALFFFGLAVGSYLFGRIAQRSRWPLWLYGSMEMGLAGLIVLSLPGFELAGHVYGLISQSQGWITATATDWPLLLVRVALVALLLVPPTVLMGGTLPLFCRHFTARGERVAWPVGGLYAINTLGAAAGCAAAGLVLIPVLGIRLTVLLAAALDFAAGAIVLTLRLPSIEAVSDRSPEVFAGRSTDQRTLAVLVFLIGFVALGNEVLWTRYLALLTRVTVLTYTVTLCAVLVGMVLGGLFAAWRFDRLVARGRVFGGLQVASALLVLTVMLLPPAFWHRMGSDVSTCFLLLLPPAVLAGASLPLAVRMVVDDPRRAGLGVGAILAINTLGGIAGSLTIGFVMLPVYGLMPSVLLTSGLSLAAGFAAWLRLDPTASIAPRIGTIAVCLAVWLAIPHAMRTRLPADFLADRDRLVDYREGLEANLAVVRARDGLVLELDRLPQGASVRTHQALAAHVPMLLHPEPKRILVVGVGAGQTAQRFLMYAIDRLDCVDIEPAVFDLISAHFDGQWLDDPRVRRVRGDGRNVLIRTGDQYDVISLELGQVFRPTVAGFYTADFYRRVRERLRPRGIVVQFVPIAFFPVEMFRSVVRTFADVFPECLLWYNTSELLLIGTPDRQFHLDRQRIERLLAGGPVHDDLRYSYWGGPDYRLNRLPVFLGGLLAGPRQVVELSAGGAILRDDRPVLDYVTADYRDAAGYQIPIAEQLQACHPSLHSALGIDLPASAHAASDRIRVRNLTDIVSRAYLRQAREAIRAGQPRAAHALLERALAENPESGPANLMMAQTLAHRGQLADAETHFKKTLEIRPDDLTARRDLADVLLRRGRPAEAVGHFEAVLNRRPEDATAHVRLAEAYEQSGQPAAALPHYRTAARLQPDLAEAIAGLAWALATALDPQSRRPEEALRLAERAAALAAKPSPRTLDALAAALAATGQFDQAARVAERAARQARGAKAEAIRARAEGYRKGQPFRQRPSENRAPPRWRDAVLNSE